MIFCVHINNISTKIKYNRNYVEGNVTFFITTPGINKGHSNTTKSDFHKESSKSSAIFDKGGGIY